MEARELLETNEPSDDLLDIYVRRMMAKVDEAIGLGPEFLRDGEARAPIRDHSRIERRLVELVLEEYPPVSRERRDDLAHRVNIAVERLGQIRLAGKVRAVGDPDGQRFRTELAADLDAFDVVRDRLSAHTRISMRQRAELVRKLLPRLILERVGIDRVEDKAVHRSLFAQGGIVVDLVPRNVRRDRRCRPRQSLDHGTIVDLLEDVARLARPRKAGEPRATRADAPGR